MDRGGGPLEGRRHLSPLGGIGALWLWRSAVHLLSANFLDARRISGTDTTLESGSHCLHHCGADALRMLDVRSGATLVAARGSCVGSGFLYGESLPSGRRLLAERICGTAGGGVFPFAPIVSASAR